MTPRRYLLVLAALLLCPIVAAAVLPYCSPTIAVAVCLVVAGAGVAGTVAGARMIADCGLRSADSRKAAEQNHKAAARAAEQMRTRGGWAL